MTTIYLIRHAEAEGNLYRRAQGQYDSLLTGRGLLQMKALEERFDNIEINAVYSSDLTRARMTAAAVYRGRGLALNAEERLREVCLGEWEDMAWGDISYNSPEQYALFSHDPEHWSVNGSENFKDVYKRVTDCVTEIAERHSGGAAAVVSHGFAIRTFLSGLLGVTSAEIHKVPHFDNTAVTLLNYENGKFSITYLGDNSHLSGGLSTLESQTWWRGESERRAENMRFTPFDSVHGRKLYGMYLRETGFADSAEEYIKALTMENVRVKSVFFAFVDNDPAGIVEIDTERASQEGVCWINLCYLTPEFRKKSLAVQLIGQAVSVSRAAGRKKLRAAVRDGEFSPIGFLLKYGFVETGEYAEKGEPVYIMEKDIYRPLTAD